MGDEKKKKSKKRSKYDPTEEINRAMREMEIGMEQMNQAFAGANIQSSGSTGGNITINNISATGNQPLIYVNNAQNLQIGNNNVMNINSDGKKKSSSSSSKRREPRKSSSSSQSDGASSQRSTTERPSAEAATRVQPEVPLQDRDPSQLTPAERNERKRYLVLNSQRKVTDDEIKLCTVYVGQFARFLRMLGLEDSKIDDLRQENQSAKEIIYQGMLLWKQNMDQDATLGALARTLQKVDCGDAITYFTP